MKTAIKALVVTAALVASGSVLAQLPAAPSQPGNPPIPNPLSSNGGLVVSIWDNTRSVSIVQYLGVSLNDTLAPSGTTPAGGPWTAEGGGTINFGTIDQFATLFGASSPSNIVYTVMAADSVLSGSTGARIVTTLAGTATIANDRVRNAANAARDFLNAVNAGYTDPNTTLCEPGDSCAANDAALAYYAGNTSTWGIRYSNDFTQDAGAPVDTSLRFYYIADNSAAPSTATHVAFQNSSGFGTWLLTAAGNLSYSIAGAGPVVPLPAAVWLLLSGLAGFVTVGRRRAAPQAA